MWSVSLLQKRPFHPLSPKVGKRSWLQSFFSAVLFLCSKDEGVLRCESVRRKVGSVCRQAGLIVAYFFENGSAELWMLPWEGKFALYCRSLRNSRYLFLCWLYIVFLCRENVIQYSFSLSSRRFLIFEGETFSSNKRYLLRGHVSCSCWGFCYRIECFLDSFICLSLLCRLNLPILLSGGY